MGIKDGFKDIVSRVKKNGARKKTVPRRDTVPYARTLQLGLMYSQKVIVKPTPPNIRYFSRTPYARQAIRRIKDPLCSLKFDIKPIDDTKPNRYLLKQCAVAKACFEHPNNEDNWRNFLGQIVEDWLVFGAGVFEQQLSNDPVRPLWMWPVDAQSIQIYPAWSGAKNEARYVQTLGYTNVGWLEGRQLRDDELSYIKANASTETPYGFGALEIAFNTINRQLGVADFAGNLATNAQPKQILFMPGLTPEKIREFRTYWINEVEGQGITPMVGGKDKPEAVQLFPGGDEGLFLEYQQFVIREIATAFGLSPMNMGIEQDVNRSTAEVSADRDWDNTIVPLAELISTYITRHVLHALLGYYQLEFKFEALYREDEESLANIYQTYYKNNAITPNEHRAELGKPPMQSEWGDKTFADFQIAMSAARGTKQLKDPDLPDGGGGEAVQEETENPDDLGNSDNPESED